MIISFFQLLILYNFEKFVKHFHKSIYQRFYLQSNQCDCSLSLISFLLNWELILKVVQHPKEIENKVKFFYIM